MNQERNAGNRAGPGGVSRRDFIKYCTVMAASLGLPLGAGKSIARAVTSPKRPPVIWLSGQGCTGCTETLLRPGHMTLENVLLNLISLDYNETLNSGAGHQAEHFRERSMQENAGKFVLVVEGSIPAKDGGIYCQVAGRPFLETVREAADKAGAIIAIGSCASWGGIPSSGPNPTGAKGAPQVLSDKTVVSVPGCPPNGYNFLSTVAYYITYGKVPALDNQGRPQFAYGRLIHENCERRPHFDAGRFADKFGDRGHQLGYCLYKLGCKGPVTYNNCSTRTYCDVGVWPVNSGHPCFGCSEPEVGFHIPQFTEAEITDASVITPSATPAPIDPERGGGASATTAALAGGAVGAALGAGAVAARKLRSETEDDSSS